MQPALILVCLFTFAFLLWPAPALAQSSDQNFPTHVTGPEINGVIKARAMGDARVTTFFYLFQGEQGDIFINVATTNFSGDIDVYSAESMKPLTKMVMYADAGRSETGRLIYLRQPARLLLRIEGRTPNDDAATFRIKFAGSFAALEPETYGPAPTVARKQTVVTSQPSAVRTDVAETPVSAEGQVGQPPEAPSAAEDPKPKTEGPGSDTVYENKSAKVTVKTRRLAVSSRRSPATTKEQKSKTKVQTARTENPKPPAKPDPLASVKLVVVFKDGTIMERPMTEISRFSFDNGRLTVIEKNGTIKRYLITDIAKVTIE